MKLPQAICVVDLLGSRRQNSHAMLTLLPRFSKGIGVTLDSVIKFTCTFNDTGYIAYLNETQLEKTC